MYCDHTGAIIGKRGMALHSGVESICIWLEFVEYGLYTRLELSETAISLLPQRFPLDEAFSK